LSQKQGQLSQCISLSIAVNQSTTTIFHSLYYTTSHYHSIKMNSFLFFFHIVVTIFISSNAFHLGRTSNQVRFQSTNGRLSLNMLDIDKSESLIYDAKNNRLYEANMDNKDSGDEFCLYDEKTGEKIFLTKVSHHYYRHNIIMYSIYLYTIHYLSCNLSIGGKRANFS